MFVPWTAGEMRKDANAQGNMGWVGVWTGIRSAVYMLWACVITTLALLWFEVYWAAGLTGLLALRCVWSLRNWIVNYLVAPDARINN